ncbi:MAG: hypothetical protein WCX88_03780 [Patescibacteria group bacterium]
MARFNAAKIFDAIDKKFQMVYNQLIDLLDTGYSTTATINGKEVTVDINPKTGISITIDGVKVFGVGSDGRLFSESLSNVETSDVYATIGDVTVDSKVTKGIVIYKKSYSTTIPFATIGTYVATGVDAIIIATHDGEASIYLGNTLVRAKRNTGVSGDSGYLAQIDHSSIVLQGWNHDDDDVSINLSADSSTGYNLLMAARSSDYLTKVQLSMSDASGIDVVFTVAGIDNGFGYDSTGFYKNDAGSKTYL